MRMRIWMVAGTLLLGGMAVGGCATTRPDGRSNSQAAWDTTKEGFGVAYNGVKSGARGVAHVGGWILEKTGNGVVRVMHMTHMGKVANYADDGWISTKLKGEYGMDPQVRASDIKVRTHNGVVTLTGTVSSEHEAEAAIRRALDTNGVRMVDSELAFPTIRNQAKTFTPGEEVRLRD